MLGIVAIMNGGGNRSCGKRGVTRRRQPRLSTILAAKDVEGKMGHKGIMRPAAVKGFGPKENEAPRSIAQRSKNGETAAM